MTSSGSQGKKSKTVRSPQLPARIKKCKKSGLNLLAMRCVHFTNQPSPSIWVLVKSPATERPRAGLGRVSCPLQRLSLLSPWASILTRATRTPFSFKGYQLQNRSPLHTLGDGPALSCNYSFEANSLLLNQKPLTWVTWLSPLMEIWWFSC